MSIRNRIEREARPTLPNGDRLVPCWLDYLRVIRATYPWWARPFVRGRCELAAHALMRLRPRVRPKPAEWCDCYSASCEKPRSPA